MARGHVCALGALLFTLALPGAIRSQDAPMIYATYYECDPAGEARADGIMTDTVAPAFDGMVADGAIGAYGWLAHHTGGPWRRVGYFLASDLGALFDAIDASDEATGDALEEIRTACPRHDDYIWSYVTGSTSGEGIATERPAAGYSMYAVCSMEGQDRADELMEEVIGPVFEARRGPDGINNWGWWEHHTGGKYRRLLVLDGASHRQVQAARDAAIEDLVANHADAFREFSSICGSHQDYLWDISIAAP